MFLKCNWRITDGKEHRYWSIVENRRCARRSGRPAPAICTWARLTTHSARAGLGGKDHRLPTTACSKPHTSPLKASSLLRSRLCSGDLSSGSPHLNHFRSFYPSSSERWPNAIEDLFSTKEPSGIEDRFGSRSGSLRMTYGSSTSFRTRSDSCRLTTRFKSSV